jgi:hypothetical protein
LTGIEIATLITAIVGFVALTLSIVNTWMQFSNNRVKLKVVPGIAYKDDEVDMWAISAIPFPDTMNAIKQKQHRLCVEVINLSSFAVTIQKVGFGKLKLLKDGINILSPTVLKRNCWPLKLESRESDWLMLKTGEDIPIDNLDKNCAFVATECGHIAYTSCAFNAYVKELKKLKSSKH